MPRIKTERLKRIGKKARKELMIIQNNRCFWCFQEFGILNWKKGSSYTLDPVLDHVVPIAAGGRTEIGNLVWACSICNQLKSAMLAEENEVRRRVLKRREALGWSADSTTL